MLEFSPTLYVVIVTRGAVATVDSGWVTESGVGAMLRLTSDIAAIQDPGPKAVSDLLGHQHTYQLSVITLSSNIVDNPNITS